MHAETETELPPSPLALAIADRITTIPDGEADASPVKLHEILSMLGVMTTYGATSDPTWSGLVDQIPGLAIARGCTIEDVWRMPAAEALPALTAHMAHILRSDRFTAASRELIAVSDGMRTLQQPSA